MYMEVCSKSPVKMAHLEQGTSRRSTRPAEARWLAFPFLLNTCILLFPQKFVKILEVTVFIHKMRWNNGKDVFNG
ncbi:hypothetical protein J2Z64_002112 [Oceanobacillus polygoni]|uniref:Uncharacterized protein n=1 Tax=Oceanobacillus polygoni TaxID=1235259 RepID=A0A9X0YTD1_9BACI|nr:hypothetical protein [Oceanobacillus polygoni]